MELFLFLKLNSFYKLKLQYFFVACIVYLKIIILFYERSKNKLKNIFHGHHKKGAMTKYTHVMKWGLSRSSYLFAFYFFCVFF